MFLRLGVEEFISGEVRQKMLVFYYRNGGTHVSSDTHIDDVCKLFGATGCL